MPNLRVRLIPSIAALRQLAAPSFLRGRDIAFRVPLLEIALLTPTVMGFLDERGYERRTGKDTSLPRLLRIMMDGACMAVVALHTRYVLPLVVLGKMAFDFGQSQDNHQALRVMAKDAIMATAGWAGARLGHFYSYMLERADVKNFHALLADFLTIARQHTGTTSPVLKNAITKANAFHQAAKAFIQDPAASEKIKTYQTAKTEFLQWFQSLPENAFTQPNDAWTKKLIGLTEQVEAKESFHLLRAAGPWLAAMFSFSMAWRLIKMGLPSTPDNRDRALGSVYPFTWVCDVVKSPRRPENDLFGPDYANGPALLNA